MDQFGNKIDIETIGGNISHEYQYQCLPKYSNDGWWKAYNVYLTIIQYFVPLIVVDSAYTIIAFKVCRWSENIYHHDHLI